MKSGERAALVRPFSSRRDTTPQFDVSIGRSATRIDRITQSYTEGLGTKNKARHEALLRSSASIPLEEWIGEL